MTEQSPAGREPRDANSIDYSTLSDQDVERADCLVPSPVAMSTLMRLLIDLAGPSVGVTARLSTAVQRLVRPNWPPHAG